MKRSKKNHSKKREAELQPKPEEQAAEEALQPESLVLNIEGGEAPAEAPKPDLILREEERENSIENSLLADLQNLMEKQTEPEPEANTPGTLQMTLEEAPAAAEQEERPASAAGELLNAAVSDLLEQSAAEEKVDAAPEQEPEALQPVEPVVPAPLEINLPEMEPAAEPPAPLKLAEEDAPAAPAQEEKPLTGITYEEVAEAIEARKDQVKEPTLTRSAIDDETLLAEIYALIGETTKRSRTPQTQEPARDEKTAAVRPEGREPSGSKDTNPIPAVPAPEPQQPVHLDAGQTVLEDPVLQQDEEGGAPGWLKGAFLLLISLLLSGMTLYAVATDVIGKLF